MKKPITVWKTSLNQKRPYLDLLYLSNSIIHIIKNNLFDNEIYNILTNNLTVRDIISNIKKYENDLNIDFVETNIMNQLSYEVLNKKFTNQDFEFKGNINTGIKETIAQLKQSNSLI